MKLVITAVLPDHLLQHWLQHVRDFDDAHNGSCEFKVIAASSTLTATEALNALDINPPLAHVVVLPKDEE